MIEGYLIDLNELDSKVRCLKWISTSDESELENELKLSREYSYKISECLALLEVNQFSGNIRLIQHVVCLRVRLARFQSLQVKREKTYINVSFNLKRL